MVSLNKTWDVLFFAGIQRTIAPLFAIAFFELDDFLAKVIEECFFIIYIIFGIFFIHQVWLSNLQFYSSKIDFYTCIFALYVFSFHEQRNQG